MLFDGVQPPQAQAEIIHIAAKNAPRVRPSARAARSAGEAGPLPSSGWRHVAAPAEIESVPGPMVQVCLPPSVRIRPGSSWLQPMDGAERSATAAFAKYSGS